MVKIYKKKILRRNYKRYNKPRKTLYRKKRVRLGRYKNSTKKLKN